MKTPNRFKTTLQQAVAPRGAPIRANPRPTFAATMNILKLASAAFASTAVMAAPANAAQPESLEEITVTSSRLESSGFDAPTPTTTIGAEDIAASGLPNIADYLNELPVFLGTNSPKALSFATTRLGMNTLNLRGLGENRTLVLVNGRRRVPSTDGGSVDINTIPMAIVERVEVVTGGASAAWGSDAVAGVVNFLLNDELDGLRTSLQYGSSTRGDAEGTHASIAYGSVIGDDLGYLVIAAEYQTTNGLGSQREREIGRQGWSRIPNPDDTGPTDGIPDEVIARNAGLLLASEGGLVLGPGPIAGTQFGPGGTPTPYNFGDSVSGIWVVGGDGGFVDSQLLPESDRKNLMATFNRDLSEAVEFFFEGSYSESSGSSNIVPPFAFPITIQSDNAFIPAEFQTQLDANGITSFGLFRLNTDHGFIRTTQKVESFTATTGFNGRFGSSWTWDVYGQYGQTTNQLLERNLLVQNRINAVDAVVSPTGEIVCRATLTGGAPGCVPLNLFGQGSPSAEAIEYVMGDAFSRQEFTQHVAAATLRGDVFEGWAGPIAAAVGVEYRKDQIERLVDEHSRDFDFLISNYQPIEGTIDVTEVFLETGVPLLSEKPMAESLDFNAAVRFTDYSTSGAVETWKVGLTYAPVQDIKLRGTVSKDIRSPNAFELFTRGQLGFSTVTDPFTGTTPFIQVLTTGNPELSEETADTTTVGIVVQPSFAPGLRASIDWYDIQLEDGIGVLDLQEVIDLCFAGDAALCSLISRNAAGQIVQLTDPQLNIAESRFSGVDFELRYDMSLQDLLPRLGGSLRFKLLGNYVDKMEFSPNGIDTLDSVGSLGVGAFGLAPGAPEWRWDGSVSYDSGAFGFTTSVRYIGEGNYNSNYTIEDLSAEDNTVDAETYVDISARYGLEMGATRMEFFLGANNVFDNDPQPLPDDFISQRPINTVLYDLLGRYVYGGVRVNFL